MQLVIYKEVFYVRDLAIRRSDLIRRRRKKRTWCSVFLLFRGPGENIIGYTTTCTVFHYICLPLLHFFLHSFTFISNFRLIGTTTETKELLKAGYAEDLVVVLKCSSWVAGLFESHEGAPDGNTYNNVGSASATNFSSIEVWVVATKAAAIYGVVELSLPGYVDCHSWGQRW